MSIIYPPKLYVDFRTGLLVYLDKSFYSKTEADKLYAELTENVVFAAESFIKIYGKQIKIPRKQVAYGDPGTTYSFSGMTVNSKPWIPTIQRIKKDVEYMTGLNFNFCLVNKYDDGTNYIGYHKDDEADLGTYVNIASVSFGAERKFYFKSDDPNVPIVKMALNPGSMCVMLHPTNLYFKHSVPKELRVKNCRINLTFRYVHL